jgi:hippurate hydrolase
MKARELIAETARNVAAAHGLTADVEIVEGFPVTICDPRAVELGKAVATEIGGDEGWRDLADPIMGAEDFAYLLEKVPGAMFFLGVANEGEDWRSCCAIHSPRMHVDENALPKGTAMLAGCALKFLSEGFVS